MKAMDLQPHCKNSVSLKNEYLEKYVDINNEVVTSENHSDESIVQGIINERNQSDDDDESEIQDDEICLSPNVSDVLTAANLLSTFVHCTYDDDKIKSAMSRIHNIIRSSYYKFLN
ncbi:uncharacterized protein LOC122502312 [Leptopilina heterotoma]|uniref:uncharacterized protein LOC122502312 n=1 Tax=Leptopilina heterotoma TaxID=63436 RepID=UPI001CA9DD61|nr:uncharacterized protein LOC122502312 [Leptopilina heterotoma]